MSGKANKARRKQGAAAAKTPAGNSIRPGEPHPDQTCPLYRNLPGGAFYDSWIDAGSVGKATAWTKAVLRDRRGADPDVSDLTRRIPYLASVYGRMIPVEAAWHLDRYLDDGDLSVQWTEDDPVTMIPAAQLARSPTTARPSRSGWRSTTCTRWAT